MTRHRVLLAEDHTLVAEGLRTMLAEDHEVVGVVPDGAAVVAAVAEHDPDLLVLDLTLPNRSGMEVLRELAANPRLRILVLTMHLSRVFADMAMRLGAAGFIPKSASSDELKEAISEIMAGRRYVSPKVPRWGRQEAGPSDPLGFRRLTSRQQEVVRLIGRGLSTAQMARALAISPWTVHFHRKRIRNSLGLRTDQELYRFAMLVDLSGQTAGQV